MLDIFNTPSPQSANYQEFYGGGTNTTWIKPRGASMVRFMLIGGGGGGGHGDANNGGGGGGSGAVTSWIGPAMFIPDLLQIYVGKGGIGNGNAESSILRYLLKNGTYLDLLSAGGGSAGGPAAGGTAGQAMTATPFATSGIWDSTTGQNGTNGGSTGGGIVQPASSTVFLSGGAGGSGAAASTGGSVTPNYGYTPLPVTTAGGTVVGADGYFISKPFIVGCGGAGGSTSTSFGTSGGRGGIGCGGGGGGEDALTGGGRGGDGAVFVWAW